MNFIESRYLILFSVLFFNKIFFQISPTHLFITRKLISTDCIENLIPDFLMESRHFFIVISDIEGKVLKFNKGMGKICPHPEDMSFADFLSPNSKEEFNYSLELMLGSPKIRRHLMLDHPELRMEGFTQIWWEFSVVTTSEMDISGIVGIYAMKPFLDQEMPCNNLFYILGFGEITLDKDLKVKSRDQRVSQWFGPRLENWVGRSIIEILQLPDLKKLNQILAHTSTGDRPSCFLMDTNHPGMPSFAAILTERHQGYHLFLMPKSNPIKPKPEFPLISPSILSLFSGAIFVLNTSGELIQQNEEAKNLGRIWKVGSYSEGFQLNFSNQPDHFSKLVSAIEDAKKGNQSDFELKFLIPNQEFLHWNVSVKAVCLESEYSEGILIQAIEMTAANSELVRLKMENDRLRDLALSPSHILRGPLSSILGILDLLDQKQLDQENQKLFGYLKPLAKELDHVIRIHAKKMSTFH